MLFSLPKLLDRIHSQLSAEAGAEVAANVIRRMGQGVKAGGVGWKR